MHKTIRRIRPAVIRGMLRKEFSQLFRDKRMRMMLIGAPVIMLIVFAFAANTDVRAVRFVLLDADRSLASREFTGKLTASGEFLLFDTVDSPEQAELYLQSNRAELFINIPADFSEQIAKGGSVKVQAILDGSDPNRAMIIFAHISAIAKSYSNERATSSSGRLRMSRPDIVISTALPVSVQERSFFNETLESRAFFLPAILALILGLIITMLTSMSIVRERESGTIEQVIVTPIRPIEFILGKIIPFGIVAVIDIILITLIIVIFFGVPLRGSFLFLIACGIIYLMASLGIGIYISTISGTQQQAMLTSFLFFLPSILLSGFIFPIHAMPNPIKIITYANPLRYFIVIVRGIFLKGIGPFELWKEIASLFALGMFFFILSIRRYKRGFE